ncbi:hypothetical protein GIB67_026698 [Kingdonia uniflora]|uniref:cyclin-dependent kinase n=1 Tax=Kingdonia uniflora TaxID=39325 RepID=A0A7J7M260_9MAGN|nr:hypothetical protein GIB67_026698 [Kingdonia uniflora]
MAAGKNWGYRVNEFRAREVDLRVDRRRDLYRFDENYDRYHGFSSKKEVFRVREREIMEKEVVIGDYGRRDDKRGGYCDREREPGELSSGSESNGVELRFHDKEISSVEDEVGLPLAKRRKIYPVVSVHTLPIKLDRDNFMLCLNESALEESKSVLTSSPPLGQIEEGELVSAPNISASRWADEVEVSRDEDISKKKKSNLSSNRETLIYELPEFTKECSEKARSRSSDSNRSGTSRAGSVSECEYHENVVEESGHIEIDSGGEVGSDGSPEPVVLPKRSSNMLQGCRSVYDFERLNKIDEGTYGVVFKAKDKMTGEIVALKKVKMAKEREGFPLTALREINILLSLHHPSIVDVKEVVMGPDMDDIFMVMEYMEHDLKALMETKPQPFSQSEVKCLMLQLLEGVNHLHENWVIHRDLKTSNILLNNRGELKICDFGLSRQYGSPLKPYTQLVVTLWYRAPELLLGAKQYSTAIDMWSLGCIMAELLTKEPLFNGKTDVDQLDKICRTLGTPTEETWPGFTKLPGAKVKFVKHHCDQLRKKFRATSFIGSPIISEVGYDLLRKLLNYDPEKRITAKDALNHEWFREVPLPKSKDFMPTFPDLHAQARRERRVMKSPDPLEEQRRRELQQGELGTGGLFS